MTKRIAILGRGTAGVLSASTIFRNYSKNENYELEWHFDSNTKTQAVGEGSTLAIPSTLYNNLGFTHNDLNQIDGTFKYGIRKINWSKENIDFFHEFPPPSVSYHFNAIALQNYVFGLLKDKIKLVDHNTTSDQIDANYVIDCSGRPKDYSLFHEPEYVPINAAYVTQCFWELPTFFYTLAIARPYGWIFGIPLRNRCSIGYMFNDTITNVELVKEDVKEIFEQFNLTPSTTTNEIHFSNYFRKTNFTKRVAYNGNASFFLEPLEATTLTGVTMVNKWACEIIENPLLVNTKNNWYHVRNINTERMLMLHYFSGSIYKNEFWDFAQERAKKCLEKAVKDPHWWSAYDLSKSVDFQFHDKTQSSLIMKSFVQSQTDDWSSWSYFCNLSDRGLNLYDKIDQLK